MPDTNKERDVEDVLSSVRRLVSGELAGAQRRRSTPQALVLTPRQRISEARPPLGAKSLEDRIAELEAQLAGRQDEWEPDGSEDPATQRPTEPIILPSSAEPTDDMGATQGDADVPRTLRRLSRIELVEPMADTEEADQTEGTHALNEDSHEADFDKNLADTVARSVNAVISEITGGEGNRAASPDEPELAATAAEAEEDLERGLDAAQALNQRLDRIAPETPVEKPVGEGQPPKGDSQSAHVSADRLEADLRDLVAQLIREELQGELGARITRNVRKLVRREIQRALAARDLS